MDTDPATTNPADPQASVSPAAPAANPTLCAICQTPLAAEEPATECPGCKARYHPDCWTENGGCAVYGCEQVPPTQARAGLEIPVAYWGQEKKPCPVCNAPILAAAVRCRSCGTVFQTARPLDSAEFSEAASHEMKAPGLRRSIVWFFVLCLIPFDAPVAGIIALLWFHSRREAIRKLPSLYGALIKIGIGVAFFQTAAIVLLAMLFMFRHT
jgi:hypothetical protein